MIVQSAGPGRTRVDAGSNGVRGVVKVSFALVIDFLLDTI